MRSVNIKVKDCLICRYEWLALFLIPRSPTIRADELRILRFLCREPPIHAQLVEILPTASAVEDERFNFGLQVGMADSTHAGNRLARILKHRSEEFGRAAEDVLVYCENGVGLLD